MGRTMLQKALQLRVKENETLKAAGEEQALWVYTFRSRWCNPERLASIPSWKEKLGLAERGEIRQSQACRAFKDCLPMPLHR